MEPDFSQNAAFYDQVAPVYDRELLRNPYDLLARRAFQDLVARYVPSSSTLLDFGCGTGLDALAYAEQGYQVIAYDNSPGMIAQLEQRCRAQIESGQIVPHSMDYLSFLERFPGGSSLNAASINFAVLNSIRDVGPLFEFFARRLAPPGWVIASVLNPIHWSRIRTLQWWRSAPNQSANPQILTISPHVSYLHSIQSLRRAAKSFQFVGRANVGSVVRYDALASGEEPIWWKTGISASRRAERALWRTCAHRLLGHFVFLVWRRDP